MDEWKLRALAAVASLILTYLVIGYTVFPAFLMPLGCEGVRGDLAANSAPNTSFNITYDSNSAELSVRHSGGETLPADRTDAIAIRITKSDGQQNHSWSGSGGHFPVRKGDIIRIGNVTLSEGSVVRIDWSGTWPDPQPRYCPNSHPTQTSITLAKRVF
jgi:hypothetical protein